MVLHENLGLILEKLLVLLQQNNTQQKHISGVDLLFVRLKNCFFFLSESSLF